MAETTVVPDAVPPVAVPETDATPTMRPAASPARRWRPKQSSSFPSSVALAIVSGLLGVVLGYPLGRRRGKKPGEAEEGTPAKPDPNPTRSLALTPPTSPGPTLASPARAKRAPARRALGAVSPNPSPNPRGETVLAPPKRARERSRSGWTLSDFLAFAELKMGTSGGAVARWSVEGDVFEYPTGRLLARVAGVDVCRRVDDADDVARPRDATPRDENARDEPVFAAKARSISRKLLLFLDPETNEVMTEFEGVAVAPAAFPYQVVEYAFSSSGKPPTSSSTIRIGPDGRTTRPGHRRGSVTATVTVGAGAAKMTLTGASVAVSRGDRDDEGEGEGRVFSVPAFLEVETEDGGRHEAYESYDYFDVDGTDGAGTKTKTPVFAWTRFGACAPFGEACVLRALARRVASHEALPETTRRFVDRNAPEYADAPRDAAEIKALQA